MEKVAYITGGSKGIGYGIAEALVNDGYHVAISGRTKESIDEAAKNLNKIKSGAVLGIVSDVRKQADEEAAVAQIIDKWGRLDVLVANAGLGHFASIEEMTTDQWNQVIDTNLTGVFHSIKAATEELKKNKGYFITIASLAGANFFPKGAAYNASKFGLVGFTQAVMLDLRPYEVKTTTIMPGSVATHFNDNEPGEKDSWKIQPEDVGQMVSDLLNMHPRTLPSKIEVRPSVPPSAKK